MTQDSQSSVEKIRNAEENSKKRIEIAKQSFSEKLNEQKIKLESETIEFEEKLREKGNEKFKVVKVEAGELVKTEMAGYESTRKQIVEEATSQKNTAKDTIVSSFKELIKF